MTQAPATPELVERLKDASERFLKWTYDQPYSGSPVISIPRHPNNIDAILCEAAAALEAQQARIAELEAVLTLARDFAETEVEMRGAAGSDMSDYQNEAQEVVDAIDQVLSSQGRREGATSDGSVA